MVDIRLLIIGVIGFFWGGMTTPLSIKLARWYGIMDMPNARKIHTSQMPRGGGLGLWVGYLLLALYLTSYNNAQFLNLRWSATGATIIFLCGYLDDMCSLSPFLRLGLHFIASALVVLPLHLAPWITVIMLVWVAGVTSAYNLIDGVNGLCISLFIASSGALCMFGQAPDCIYMGAMALGVLCWNFPMAETFLGDGGSTLLGYLFGAHFASSALPALPNIRIHELILLLLLYGSVPVLDTMVAFSRRILMGRSPFYPDKGHLHHILMAWTGSPFWSVVVLLILHALILASGFAVYVRLASIANF